MTYMPGESSVKTGHRETGHVEYKSTDGPQTKVFDVLESSPLCLAWRNRAKPDVPLYRIIGNRWPVTEFICLRFGPWLSCRRLFLKINRFEQTCILRPKSSICRRFWYNYRINIAIFILDLGFSWMEPIGKWDRICNGTKCCCSSPVVIQPYQPWFFLGPL